MDKNMELEIIPLVLSHDLFEDYTSQLMKLENSKYCYITNLDLMGKILVAEMPIENKRLAIKNIFKFLTFLDVEMKIVGKSLLPLSSDLLRTHLPSDSYREYLDILQEMDVLSQVPYDDGTFYKQPNGEPGLCKQYRVHNSYLNNEDLCIVILDNDRAKDRFTYDEKLNIDKRYVNTIKNLDINMKDAIMAEVQHCREKNLSANNLRIRISRLFYTKMKRFIKVGTKVDRIYHSFTNVSKVSRKHLTKKFYNIDIKNSQPLLLVGYLMKNEMDYDELYKDDCENGNFYENFITDTLTRDDVKKGLYKNVFFGFNKNSKINKLFNRLYPRTWNSLKDIADTEVSLASRLQNLESELFNNLIPKRSKSYFTLFDAIYFDGISDIVPLNNNIIEFFRSIGVSVTTTIEY
jgi:hypothetical protein